MNSEILLSAQRTLISEEAPGDSGLPVSTWVSIGALIITLLIAVGNYVAVERRQRDDIVRNAISELTTGNISLARDVLMKWVAGGRSGNLEDVRAYYFELCWAYQRCDVASRIWGPISKKLLGPVGKDGPTGLDDLKFHLQQISVSAHQFHNSLNMVAEKLVEDSDIWKSIGSKMATDVKDVGIEDPDSNELYDAYYKSKLEGEK